MNANTWSQATHTLKLIDDKKPSLEHIRVLHDGYLADLVEAIMNNSVQSRDEFRKANGLPSLQLPTPEHVVLPDEFQFIVDYGMDLAMMISVGRYDWVNRDITTDRFPLNGSGKTKVDAKLVYFGYNISSENVVKELDKKGFRPATIEELLAFGVTNPEIQRQFPVVALGSVCKVDGDRVVACLFRSVSGRSLDLGLWHGDWLDYFRFLAVRK